MCTICVQMIFFCVQNVCFVYKIFREFLVKNEKIREKLFLCTKFVHNVYKIFCICTHDFPHGYAVF